MPTDKPKYPTKPKKPRKPRIGEKYQFYSRTHSWAKAKRDKWERWIKEGLGTTTLPDKIRLDDLVMLLQNQDEFTSIFLDTKSLSIEIQIKDAEYLKKVVEYEKDIQRYEEELLAYEEAIRAYEKEMAAFRREQSHKEFEKLKKQLESLQDDPDFERKTKELQQIMKRKYKRGHYQYAY